MQIVFSDSPFEIAELELLYWSTITDFNLLREEIQNKSFEVLKEGWIFLWQEIEKAMIESCPEKITKEVFMFQLKNIREGQDKYIDTWILFWKNLQQILKDQQEEKQ